MTTSCTSRSRWIYPLLACVVAAAGGLATAQTASPPAATRPAATRPATRPAGVVTPANKAAAGLAAARARELFDQNKLQEAWAQNEQALALDPSNFLASTLRKALQERLAGTGAAGGGGGDAAVPAGKIKPLTAAQISSIRLMEIPANDTRITGRIPRKTLDAFWEQVVKKDPGANVTQQDYNAFVNPNNFAAQARRIQESRNAEFINQVVVDSDPSNMLAFRTSVHQYILQNCATAECHAGEKAGAFRLLPAAAGTPEAVAYTNFYILSTYASKAGKLIDRNNPENSLLLQYGLPARIAKIPHQPPIRQRFADTNDAAYKSTFAWIKTLAFPMPNYGIKMEGAATQPK